MQQGYSKIFGFRDEKAARLYAVSVDAKLIYVGVTRQSMRTRFRMGFKATGENGYYDYAWRHRFKEAEGPPSENPERDVETVEAEVVFLARLAGQWPEGQTEIHFHSSTQEHREIVCSIWQSATSTSQHS